ncbi:hypothetical protein K488DRAFT_82671 [Vararia minispora EC-137]|uniref:Uncharacterized protein n=1 Tax=Vararia minispora EC-137 TaxID=1314806 RepID=A0ACB8QVR4_9AGAM|nr:hypothetical protein K488DRAFT_82671 [Vararia minispora EC-137]
MSRPTDSTTLSPDNTSTTPSTSEISAENSITLPLTVIRPPPPAILSDSKPRLVNQETIRRIKARHDSMHPDPTSPDSTCPVSHAPFHSELTPWALHLFRAPTRHAGATVWHLKCRPIAPVEPGQHIPVLISARPVATVMYFTDITIVDALVVSAKINIPNLYANDKANPAYPRDGDHLLFPNETIRRPWRIAVCQLIAWRLTNLPMTLFQSPPSPPLPKNICPALERIFSTRAPFTPLNDDQCLETDDEHQFEYLAELVARDKEPDSLYMYTQTPYFDPPVYPTHRF